MSVKTTFKATKLGKTLKKLSKEGSVTFKTGLFGSDDSEMVMIGAVHEFGTEFKVKKTHFVPPLKRIVKEGTIIKIPARRWLSLAYTRNEKFYKQLLAKQIKKIVEGKTSFEEANKKIAIILSSKTKSELGIDMPPPLKYRDGTPLVDNGDLRRSIGTKIITNKGKSSTIGRGNND